MHVKCAEYKEWLSCAYKKNITMGVKLLHFIPSKIFNLGIKWEWDKGAEMNKK